MIDNIHSSNYHGRFLISLLSLSGLDNVRSSLQLTLFYRYICLSFFGFSFMFVIKGKQIHSSSFTFQHHILHPSLSARLLFSLLVKIFNHQKIITFSTQKPSSPRLVCECFPSFIEEKLWMAQENSFSLSSGMKKAAGLYRWWQALFVRLVWIYQLREEESWIEEYWERKSRRREKMKKVKW